ncbi:hypothetical protein LINGRAHAP2_LOCUS28347 [Linum grandiflorum]
MVIITPFTRITLIHHFCQHTLPVLRRRYINELEATFLVLEPPRRQRHDGLLVGVELVIALRRPTTIGPLLKAVYSQGGLGVLGDRRGAFVGRV